VTCQSREDSRVILAKEALQVVALGKILHVCRAPRPAEYLNIELNGLADAGCAARQRNEGHVTA
jgi:hypothetical protein